MSWLVRVLGLSRATPPNVQAAIDTASAARDATDDARAAVDAYWKARGVRDRAREQAVLDDYAEAEDLRRQRGQP